MDYHGLPRGSIRSEALRRLACLSVQNTPASLQQTPDDVAKDHFLLLLAETKKHQNDSNTSNLLLIPILLKEYEALVALCDATECDMRFPKQASLLLEKLKLYLLELPSQKFASAIARGLRNTSPWIVLGQKLTLALINLADKFDRLLEDQVLVVFSELNTVMFKDQTYELSNYFTLLGVIEGFTKKPAILTRSPDAFKIFVTLDTCVDNFEFLNDVESYSNLLYSQPDNEYLAMVDEDVIMDFSPVLYIECLSKLMCLILNSILDNSKLPLSEYLLSRVSTSFDDIGRSTPPELALSGYHMDLIKTLSDIAVHKMEFLDRGETYIVYLTFTRLKIGYLAKSYNLQAIACGTFTDNIDVKVAKRIFKNCLLIYDVMLDARLGASVIQLGSLLVYKDPSILSSLTRAFTSLVANPKFNSGYCQKASVSVGQASKVLSQDAVVTTIYALTNLLFVHGEDRQVRSRRNTGLSLGMTKSISRHALLSSVDGDQNHQNQNGQNQVEIADYPSTDAASADYLRVCENAVTAIVAITEACEDETVSTLAVTILSQKTLKLDLALGPLLLRGLVSCAPFLPEREFVILVRLLNRMALEAFETSNHQLLKMVEDARVELSRKLRRDHPLFIVCLQELLVTIVSKGDVQVLEHHRSHNEISEIGDQISLSLRPLAELLPQVHAGEEPLELTDSVTINMFRNIWFNMVVHGYTVKSKNAVKHAADLERIAYSTPPLASEMSWDRTETSLDLNTVLRRGLSNHNVKDHRHIVGDVFEVPRTLSYAKLMFLAATIFVENFRVKLGDCLTILQYFSDPLTKTSGVSKYLGYIAFKVGRDFVYLVNCGADVQFAADNIAIQLTNMLAMCCHRVEELQDAALQCTDLLINKVPSALCHHKSLFALFDLLTLLYDSVLDAERNQYEPTFVYRAKKTGIRLELSDSYAWRSDTFNRFVEKATNWVRLVLLKCNHDARSLILSYVSDLDLFNSDRVQFGVSFAIDMAGGIYATDRELTSIAAPAVRGRTNLMPAFVSQLSWRSNFLSDLVGRVSLQPSADSDAAFVNLRAAVHAMRQAVKQSRHPPENTVDLLDEIAGFALVSEKNTAEMIRYLVEIPFLLFDPRVMEAAIGIWFAVMKDRPAVLPLVVSEICKRWHISVDMRQGLFSTKYDAVSPEYAKMDYAPSDYRAIDKLSKWVSKQSEPNLQVIKLLSSNFEATLNQLDHLLKLFTNFVEGSLKGLQFASLHPFARYVRFELIRFACDVLNYHVRLGSRSVVRLTELILDASLSWFRRRANYPFGTNQLKIKADYGLLKEVTRLMSSLNTFHKDSLETKKIILMFFLDDEVSKIAVWLNPTSPTDTRGSYISNQISGQHIKRAYLLDPILAVNLALRYKVKNLDQLLQQLITAHPMPSVLYPDAVQYFIGINAGTNMPSHHLLFWEPLAPVDAITLFLPPFGNNPYVLQYTMRSLEHHDVNLTFFYVPQIVQLLRFDSKGYVQRFIIETAKISQLFAHQIIWNMLANSYKDEDSTEPDSLKPKLDSIQELMLSNLSQQDLDFYKREFGFFNEVTAISGKLKPYIKKSKAEKKNKIDEEMALIRIEPDVYLPSNPDGVVVDINRKSGKPLQSHAKAPFMATFKIKKEVDDVDEDGNVVKVPIEKWQSAIFKVGDDCRQDFLALQLISVFRSIWAAAGLDLYVFPYRVTATAPGCGVIDVLPNSISRDMLGREAVNGLYEYYISKFGPENSIEFQRARNNLVRSLAAYSIISYLLQFKDRHNGNIMYDDQGHILHIDFGFCFDIVPGGVKFENVPFKLTHEMVMVLGGSDDTQAFRWYEELCVKGFLACRPYMETIVRCVNPMLESGLPCFKDTTIKKLRLRFVPNKSEKEASLYFKSLVKKSMESFYTKGYDEFQRITNGIPY